MELIWLASSHNFHLPIALIDFPFQSSSLFCHVGENWALCRPPENPHQTRPGFGVFAII
jgi:hypothetical protein